MQWSPMISRITIERCQDCLSLTRSILVLLRALKQFIHLKWPLISLTFTFVITNKTSWILSIFRKRRSPYFPAKKQQHGLKDWDFYCNRFSNLKVFDITITMDILLIYNSLDKVSEHISLEFSSYKSFFTRENCLGKKWLKLTEIV